MTRAERRKRAQKERENLFETMKSLKPKTALIALKKEIKSKPNKAQLFREVAQKVLSKELLKEFKKAADGEVSTKNLRNSRHQPVLPVKNAVDDSTRFEKFSGGKKHGIDDR